MKHIPIGSTVSFAIVLLGILGITSARAQSPAVYVVSGKVVRASSTGHAACPQAGSKVLGESFFPGFQGNPVLHGNGFTIVITPAPGIPAVAYNFPPLSGRRVTSDTLHYVLPPEATSHAAAFTLTLRTTTASSLSLVLSTETNSQDTSVSAATGTCHITYDLLLTKGLPANLKSLL